MAKPKEKAEAKSEVKIEVKTEVKTEGKPKVKTPEELSKEFFEREQTAYDERMKQEEINRLKSVESAEVETSIDSTGETETNTDTQENQTEGE